MADEAEDVKTEETTSEVPSTETETTNEGSDSSETPEAKTVPYDRLREVIEDRNSLKEKIAALEEKVSTFKPATPAAPANPQEEQVKQQLDKYLKDLGYVNKQELEQKDADRQLSETITSLESKYDGKSGLPKFDRSKVLRYAQDNLIGNVEVAYKQMNEAAIMDFRIKEALGKTKGVKSEISDGSGSSNIGTTDSDLKAAASQGDRSALQTLIKRTL